MPIFYIIIVFFYIEMDSYDNGIWSSNSDSPANRASAEEMDLKRQQNIAYKYLCHLEEAKKLVFT
jgi:hypothetical protein